MYPLCFRLRFGNWPDFPFPLGLLLLGLVSIYVHGRYFDHDHPHGSGAVTTLVEAVLALTVSMALYLSCNWIAASTKEMPDSRSLLLPFVALATLISTAAQVSLNGGSLRFKVLSRWLLLGASEGFVAVQQVALWRRLHYSVGQWATLGPNWVLVCGTRIGHHAYVGAGAVLNRDMKPFALMMDVPALQVGWMSAFRERVELPFQLERSWSCPQTGDRYQVAGDQLIYHPQQS
jgi:hypothetical protein